MSRHWSRNMFGGGGTLYWQGVWGPPTGHAYRYILKILMTAVKCFFQRKTSELLPSDQQRFPPSLSLSLGCVCARCAPDWIRTWCIGLYCMQWTQDLKEHVKKPKKKEIKRKFNGFEVKYWFNFTHETGFFQILNHVSLVN